jgi:hypothetical protein
MWDSVEFYLPNHDVALIQTIFMATNAFILASELLNQLKDSEP